MRISGFRSICFAAFFVFSVLLFFVPSAFSAQVTFQWDQNDTNPEGYKLFSRLENQSYDYENPVWSGSGAETSCTVTLEDGTGYYFVVRAFDGAAESSDSNEVHHISSSASDGQDGGVDPGTGDQGTDPTPSDGTQDDGAQTGDSGSSDTPNDSGLSDAPPILIAPVMQNSVSLTPVLKIDSASNAKAGMPVKTQWQIALDAGFSQLVFDLTSGQHLTKLTVPDLVLEFEAEYYWRVRWIDGNGLAGDWSQSGSFVTIASYESEDLDSNGILDRQEIASPNVDLDSDGTPDLVQNDLMCVKTAVGDAMIGIKPASYGVSVVSMKSVGDDARYNTDNKPQYMDIGVVSFKLFLQDGVDTAYVTIYFSEPAPDDAQWFKYDNENGWWRFGRATFSEDRRSVTIMLEDGGYGDDDGVRNGIIVDPSGLVFQSADTQSQLSIPSAEGGSSGGGGCFISESIGGSSLSAGAMALGFITAFMLLGAAIVRSEKQRVQ